MRGQRSALELTNLPPYFLCRPSQHPGGPLHLKCAVCRCLDEKAMQIRGNVDGFVIERTKRFCTESLAEQCAVGTAINKPILTRMEILLWLNIEDRAGVSDLPFYATSNRTVSITVSGSISAIHVHLISDF